jgi:hypothetical protein
MNLLIYLYNWNVEKCIKYPYALGDKPTLHCLDVCDMNCNIVLKASSTLVYVEESCKQNVILLLYKQQKNIHIKQHCYMLRSPVEKCNNACTIKIQLSMMV